MQPTSNYQTSLRRDKRSLLRGFSQSQTFFIFLWIYKSTSKSLILGVFALFIAGISLAQQDVTWTGTVDSDWGNTSNWSPAVLPTSVDTVHIPAAGNDPIVDKYGICNRLLIESGGVLTIDTGADLNVVGTSDDFEVQAGGTLAIQDGQLTITSDFGVMDLSSIVNISGGVLNIGDDWSRGDLGSNAYGTITVTGGMINIAEDCEFSRGASRLVGNFSGNHVLTVGEDFKCSANNLTYTSGTLKLTASNTSKSDLFGQSGNDDVEIFNLILEAGNSNDTIYALVHNTNGDNTKGGDLTIKGDLQIVSGVFKLKDETLDGGNHQINIGGDLTVTGGQIAANNSLINFNGSVDQNITLNGQEFDKVKLTKTGGDVLIQDDFQVNTSLDFNSAGNTSVISTGTNMVVFSDGATATDAHDDGLIVGWVEKVGDDAFVYPTGIDGNYMPISISAPILVTDRYRAKYFNDNSNSSYSHASKEITLDHLSTVEYWELNEISGNSDLLVSLSWNTSSGGVDQLAELRVAKWNGTQWEDHGNGGTSGDLTSGSVVCSAAITSFSPFAVGSSTSNNTLPAEFISFDVNIDGQELLLNWTVENEFLVDYYEVERSFDGLNWMTWQRKKAINNMNRHSYSLVDKAQFGLVYYKLSRVDLDGVREMLEIESFENEAFNVAPNPFEYSFVINGVRSDDFNYTIVDELGRNVSNEVLVLPFNNVTYEFDCSNLSPGVYYLFINGMARRIVKR